jgi:uncharacterized protein
MTWDELEKEIEKLATKITTPIDILVPITRGGLIPGRLLATKLKVKTIYALTVEKEEEKRNIVTEINKDLKNQTILLVEDMLETGKSMIVAKKYLESKGAKVLTACLYRMEHTQIVPDFYLNQVSKVLTYPWE